MAKVTALRTLSYSRLEKFETCPYSFYLRYLVGIPEPPNRYMQLGRLAHELIHVALTDGESAESAVERLRSRYGLLEEKDFQDAVGMANRFLREYRPEGWYKSEYETKDPVAGVPFHAVFDLVEKRDGTLVITDFKTEWEPYNPSEKRQLPLYAWLAARHFKASRVLVRLWFLRYSPRSGKNPVREEVIPPEVVKEALDWVSRTVAAIREAEELPGALGFPPRPGKACTYCGSAYALRCLEETLAAGEYDGDPAFRAGVVLRLERVLEDLKERLKEDVRASGPVEVGGVYFDFYPRSVWRFEDVQGLVGALASAGEDPWKVLKVDGWELRRLFRRKPELEPVVRRFGEEKIETYFSHRDQPAEQQKEGEDFRDD
ncbi:MAG: RecB family exonuclease [Moorellales bacterium]